MTPTRETTALPLAGAEPCGSPVTAVPLAEADAAVLAAVLAALASGPVTRVATGTRYAAAASSLRGDRNHSRRWPRDGVGGTSERAPAPARLDPRTCALGRSGPVQQAGYTSDRAGGEELGHAKAMTIFPQPGQRRGSLERGPAQAHELVVAVHRGHAEDLSPDSSDMPPHQMAEVPLHRGDGIQIPLNRGADLVLARLKPAFPGGAAECLPP